MRFLSRRLNGRLNTRMYHMSRLHVIYGIGISSTWKLNRHHVRLNIIIKVLVQSLPCRLVSFRCQAVRNPHFAFT